ncbi:hypothetical protein, partial [Methylobacterium radiotolerans]
MEGPIKLQAAASHRLQGGAGVLAEETGRDRPDRVVHLFEKEHVRMELTRFVVHDLCNFSGCDSLVGEGSGRQAAQGCMGSIFVVVAP